MSAQNRGISVTKALTPEETAILGNIKSLIQELEGGGGNPEQAAPVQLCDDGGRPVRKSDIPGGGDEENPILKDESGRESAEQKMDELPVDDEEALGVLKALMGGSRVAKAAKPQSDTERLLSMLVKKSLQQDKALNDILEGMGVTKRMLRVKKAAPKAGVQPSANDILNALGQLVVEKSAARPAARQEPGTLKDVLTGLWS